jgi:hypothetical protein
LIDFARHEAQLRERTDDGTTRRAYLEAAARRGSETAQAALDGPAFPYALAPLWAVFERLDMMRAAGMNGPERLTPSHIRDASLLFGWRLQPHEVDALVALDLATLHPHTTAAAPSTEPPRAVVPAWPERKR